MNHAADNAAANAGPREAAIICGRRIFYRPEFIVDALIATFRDPPGEQFATAAAIAQVCFERPIRMGATSAVFGLRPAHWPMLNLLDAADRDRRAFAVAMVAAVAAAREIAPP